MEFLDIGGTPLHWECIGSGDPLLLLHGGGATLETLRPQARALALSFSVHAYERPGHGLSPETAEPFTYHAWVRQAVAVLDALDLTAVHVVGHSDGGIIGLMLAITHPGRVRSLTTISANLDPTGFDWSDGELTAAVAALPSPADDTSLADRLWRLWLTAPHIEPIDLATIRVPTLVVAGDRDSIRPEHTRLVAASIPGARLELMADATHDLVDEKPELLSVILHSFLTVSQGASQTEGEARTP